MRVILEGPDNAGKSTLANALIGEVSGIMYSHPGGKPDDLEHEYLCISDQLALLNKYPSIIMDRITPISQMVYNPDPLLDRHRREAMWRLIQTDCLIVYCRPSTDRLLRTQDLTWREGESDEHKEKIIRNQHVFVQRYDALMATVPCVTYDFEGHFASAIRTQLVKALRGSDEAVAWFNNLILYRGGIK
jgi:GTPase SAR1 family protein